MLDARQERIHSGRPRRAHMSLQAILGVEVAYVPSAVLGSGGEFRFAHSTEIEDVGDGTSLYLDWNGILHLVATFYKGAARMHPSAPMSVFGNHQQTAGTWDCCRLLFACGFLDVPSGARLLLEQLRAMGRWYREEPEANGFVRFTRISAGTGKRDDALMAGTFERRPGQRPVMSSNVAQLISDTLGRNPDELVQSFKSETPPPDLDRAGLVAWSERRRDAVRFRMTPNACARIHSTRGGIDCHLYMIEARTSDVNLCARSLVTLFGQGVSRIVGLYCLFSPDVQASFTFEGIAIPHNDRQEIAIEHARKNGYMAFIALNQRQIAQAQRVQRELRRRRSVREPPAPVAQSVAGRVCSVQ